MVFGWDPSQARVNIPLFFATIVSLFGAGAAPFLTAPAPAPAPSKPFRRLRLRLRLRIPGFAYHCRKAGAATASNELPRMTQIGRFPCAEHEYDIHFSLGHVIWPLERGHQRSGSALNYSFIGRLGSNSHKRRAMALALIHPRNVWPRGQRSRSKSQNMPFLGWGQP